MLYTIVYVTNVSTNATIKRSSVNGYVFTTDQIKKLSYSYFGNRVEKPYGNVWYKLGYSVNGVLVIFTTSTSPSVLHLISF